MWNQNWGETLWGTGIIPGLSPIGLLVCGMLLLGFGVFAARRRRLPAALSWVLMAGLVAAPLAALAAVTLPFTFSNGTPADADEVNANFAALVAAVEANQTRLEEIDQMFLTTNACPAGYTAVEDGYIKLGASGLTTVPQPRTLVAQGHTHGRGTLAIGLGGNHTHQYSDYYWHDSGIDPNYGTPTGDGTGQRLQVQRTSGNAGEHLHAITGTVGNGVFSGDADLGVNGELERVVLRLCVKL